jgi:hypothetical protein
VDVSRTGTSNRDALDTLILKSMLGFNGIPRLSAPGRRVHPDQLSARDQHDRVRHQRHRETAGFYSDAAGNSHGFIYAGGAFSTLDVAGARSALLTRIKNGGLVTGACYDALNEGHGITGL